VAPRAWTPHRPRTGENCIKLHGIYANALRLICRAMSNMYQISGMAVNSHLLDLGSSGVIRGGSSPLSPIDYVSAERRFSFLGVAGSRLPTLLPQGCGSVTCLRTHVRSRQIIRKCVGTIDLQKQLHSRPSIHRTWYRHREHALRTRKICGLVAPRVFAINSVYVWWSNFFPITVEGEMTNGSMTS
jgi:hypothetical protein